MTGKFLDELLSQQYLSNMHIVEMLEYDRVNDEWVFLAEGEDFPKHLEGCPAPFVCPSDLRIKRYRREGWIKDE
jgi:hypothetical protein